MNLAAHTTAQLFPKFKTLLQRLHCAGKQWYGYIQDPGGLRTKDNVSSEDHKCNAHCTCWKTVIWMISRGGLKTIHPGVAWRQYMLNVMNTDDKTKLPGPLVKEILDQIPYCRYLRKYWTNPKEILVEIQYWRYLRKHQTNPKEILDKI